MHHAIVFNYVECGIKAFHTLDMSQFHKIFFFLPTPLNKATNMSNYDVHDKQIFSGQHRKTLKFWSLALKTSTWQP